MQQAVGDFLSLNGVHAKAETAMELLASNGYLKVTGSQLHANEKLSFGALRGAKFTLGQDTRTSTDKTAIEMQGNASISGSGAEVRQNSDGSITFHVGSPDSKR